MPGALQQSLRALGGTTLPSSLPSLEAPHSVGDRAEASQLSTAVVCALPLALTPGAESRGVPAGCDVPGVLIPAAGTLLPPPPRISQRRAPGMLAELQPVSTQALRGEALLKAEAPAGVGAMLSPLSQHCWL